MYAKPIYVMTNGTWVNKSAPVAETKGIIAITTHNPVSQLTVNTSSATYADVDAANLAVTFTVPASGSVLVELEGVGYTPGNCELGWNLREATADITGTNVSCAYSANQNRYRTSHVVTGLTPGASKTYKWGHARLQGAAAVQTQAGATRGAAVMRVTAL